MADEAFSIRFPTGKLRGRRVSSVLAFRPGLDVTDTLEPYVIGLFAPPAAPTGNAYRYWRWRVTAVRTDTGADSLAQIAEFNLMAGGSRLAPSSVVGLGDDGGSEGVSCLDDTNTSNKWLTTRHAMQAVWDMGTAVTPDAYRWYTANDADGRDPVSWVLEASDDPDAWWWTVIDTVTAYSVTTSRNTLVNTWTITPPTPDTPPARSGQAWRYWRFTPTARRGGGSTTTQFSELHMTCAGRRTVSTGQSGPAGTGAEGVDQADDWAVLSKLVGGTPADCAVTLDLGSSLACDGYEWFTANDATDRDPVSWTLEGSDDNSTWTTVDTQTSVTITTSRLASAFSGSITASGVSGTVAVTLGATTSAASGSPVAAGSTAATLGAVTSTASGTPVVSSSTAQTLGTLTSAAAGSPIVTGTVAATLGAVTCAADGDVGSDPVTGTVAVTLGVVTSATGGAPVITGTVAATLGDVTAAAAGTPTATGTVAVTLDGTTAAATGTPAITGTATITLGLLTCAAEGSIPGPAIVGRYLYRWTEPAATTHREPVAAGWGEPGLFSGPEPSTARWAEPAISSGGDQ